MLKRFSSYRIFVTLILLISFSATQLPVELLHHHHQKVICSTGNQETGICKHKSHITTGKDHCLACSIHIEKNFLPSRPIQEQLTTWVMLTWQVVNSPVPAKPAAHTTLRGPPSMVA